MLLSSIDKKANILTLQLGKPIEKKPVLVMIHGFVGSNFFFLKLYKELAKHFCIFAFDMYGMGLSYRYEFQMKDFESCMTLYTRTFEEWRKRLKIENFYVLGYSLGGYILMHY